MHGNAGMQGSAAPLTAAPLASALLTAPNGLPQCMARECMVMNLDDLLLQAVLRRNSERVSGTLRQKGFEQKVGIMKDKWQGEALGYGGREGNCLLAGSQR